MSECFKTYHCFWKISDHCWSSVLNDTQDSQNLSRSYRLTTLLYILLCSNHCIITSTQNSFVEDIIKKEHTEATCSSNYDWQSY